jgi:nucleoside-diphosphate-sugar epimerase
VVFASSSSVYGNTGELPRKESAPADPIAPYAVAKLAAERFCVSFSRVYEIEAVALRYFNVFGPRQDPRSQYAAAVPRFIQMIWEGQPVPIYGDGMQSRDFTYVANVVEANLLAANADGVNGGILNVATGSPISVNDLADTIGVVLDREVEKTYLPPRPGDVRDSSADLTAARELLGYETSVGLEEGLRRTADFLLAEQPVDAT